MSLHETPKLEFEMGLEKGKLLHNLQGLKYDFSRYNWVLRMMVV